ncbi:MAG: hypothetical protein JST84_24325 [Acidobacteria bacterium]|nr:hypothetical protein [Acidobacteriota bacterium]
MPKVTLKEGMKITLQNTIYDIATVHPQGQVELRTVASGEQQTLSIEAILAAYSNGQLVIGQSRTSENQTKRESHPAVPSINDDEKAKAIRRVRAAPGNAAEPTAPTQPYLITLIDTHSRLLAGFAFIQNRILELQIHKTYSPKINATGERLDVVLRPTPTISPQFSRRPNA